MKYLYSKKYYFLICLVASLVAGCDTTNSNDEPDNIFGYWKLDRIVYETGDVLRPGDGDSSPTNPEDEIHLLGFHDTEVFADGVYHKRLSGVSYCNSLSGSFIKKPGHELEIHLGASRAACGISAEFIFAVESTHSYDLTGKSLVLLFEYEDEELEQTFEGQVFLVRFIIQ